MATMATAWRCPACTYLHDSDADRTFLACAVCGETRPIGAASCTPVAELADAPECSARVAADQLLAPAVVERLAPDPGRASDVFAALAPSGQHSRGPGDTGVSPGREIRPCNIGEPGKASDKSRVESGEDRADLKPAKKPPDVFAVLAAGQRQLHAQKKRRKLAHSASGKDQGVSCPNEHSVLKGQFTFPDFVSAEEETELLRCVVPCSEKKDAAQCNRRPTAKEAFELIC